MSLITDLAKISGSKRVFWILLSGVVIVGLGLSFLIMWPCTVFLNSMIALFGGVVVLKVWQVFLAVALFNFLFVRNKKL